VDDLLLDRARILSYLRELADVLAETTRHPTELVVVGGSYMALRSLRDATRDVDSIRQLASTVKAAIATVGERHGLTPDWLNDRAAGYAPFGWHLGDCELLLDEPMLRVYTPSPRIMFVMKVFAERTIDHDDLVALWPLCGFTDAEEALAHFDAAYPQAKEDAHRIEWIARIQAEAND
jgi:hypothetical protein